MAAKPHFCYKLLPSMFSFFRKREKIDYRIENHRDVARIEYSSTSKAILTEVNKSLEVASVHMSHH